MYCVVGSGPAGVMCAYALVKKGYDVLMVDVGRECEPDKAAVIRDLSTKEPTQWNPQMVDRIRGDMHVDSAGIPLKFAFGSDYPYAIDELASIRQDNTRCTVSFAQGGLSNVWGAAMLPNRPSDFEAWPFPIEEMVSSYAEVARIVGLAGSRDDLEELYPYYASPEPSPALSGQAAYLLGRLQANREDLRKKGFVFGGSRLAVKTRADTSLTACQHCGLCLSGCPYACIYNTRQTLQKLLAYPNFEYRASTKVEKVEEVGERVILHCISQEDENYEEFCLKAERVFLACGVLSTTKVMVRSLDLTGELKILCQPYFLLPMVMAKNFPHVENERLHTLSQLFIDIEDSDLSSDLIHLQLYTYNDMIGQRLEQVISKMPLVGSLVRKLLLGRLVALQGYLNATEAKPIRVVIRRDSSYNDVSLCLEGGIGQHTQRVVRRIERRLLYNARRLGALPLQPLSHIGVPGEGNHIGGVFPMCKAPMGMQSDSMGRIAPFKKVHIVDGSVLTTIPSSTITYTIMANAHRIGAEV